MQPTRLSRRSMVASGLAITTTRLRAQPKPPQNSELVKAFVIAGHFDANIPKVKEMLTQDPKLAVAAWDWGAGDWETALGGAGPRSSSERELRSQTCQAPAWRPHNRPHERALQFDQPGAGEVGERNHRLH